MDCFAGSPAVSERFWSNSLKALYGVPVASYLRGLRMDTAARLLQESDLPVAEIAHRVGYEDPSRFAAAFRRHTGRRPTELRRVACPTASSHTA